jgi:hypothetical protein
MPRAMRVADSLILFALQASSRPRTITEAIDEAIPCAGSDHVRQGLRFSDLVNITARETESL